MPEFFRGAPQDSRGAWIARHWSKWILTPIQNSGKINQAMKIRHHQKPLTLWRHLLTACQKSETFQSISSLKHDFNFIE